MKSGQYLSSSSTQNIKRVHLQFECNIKVVPGPSPDTLNIRELFIYNEHLCSLKTRRQKTECNVLNLRYDLWSYDFEFTFFLSVYQLCSKQSRVQMQTRYWHTWTCWVFMYCKGIMCEKWMKWRAVTNYITRLLTQTGREVELKLARVENEAVLVLSSIVQYSRGQRVHCTVSNQSKYSQPHTSLLTLYLC